MAVADFPATDNAERAFKVNVLDAGGTVVAFSEGRVQVVRPGSRQQVALSFSAPVAKLGTVKLRVESEGVVGEASLDVEGAETVTVTVAADGDGDGR